MNRPATSLRLFSIRGVGFHVHISLLILLVYVILISALQFPAMVNRAGLDPVSMTLGPWAAATVFAFGLLISIALHELGHVMVAQARGVPVHSITLMMLGGVSEIGHVAMRPMTEFKMAVVGPLVSFALGFGLWGLKNAFTQPELVLFCYWLGTVNITLGIFNMLPAFPLDGGRALRSLMAASWGHTKATRLAVKVSQISAWILGLMGLLAFNLFIVLIALFIYSAAQSEWAILITQGALRGLKVKEAMTPVRPLSGDIKLKEAAEEMIKLKKKILPVVESEPNKRVGLVSLEVIRRVAQDQWGRTSLGDVMVPVNRVLNLNESVGDILMDILTAPYHSLPVQDGRSTVGVISYSDLTDIVHFRLLERSGRGDVDDQDIAA